MSDSIDDILLLPQRKLVVSASDIDLHDNNAANDIFILMVEESQGSAGGRAGGSGHRRINKIYHFLCEGNRRSRLFQTEDSSWIEKFDIPYSAVAMDIRMSDGRTHVVQGVVDPGLVSLYKSTTSNLK